MGRSRTTMQEQQFRRGIVPDALGPDVELAFGRAHWNHPHAATEDVVPAGVVQVRLGAHRDSYGESEDIYCTQ